MPCPAHKFSMTCDFNWKKALDNLKPLLKFPLTINAAKAFCPYVDPYEELDVENIDCGKRKLSSGRIWGGEQVERSSIPWQVAIFDHEENKTDPECGGTLISQYHVLSAAHCFEYPKNCRRYSVGLGMHRRNVSDGTRISIHHISNHPGAKIRKHCGTGITDFDFSVLHLLNPFTFNNEIQPACLPDSSMTNDFLVGKDLTVSGWGAPYPDVLQKATYRAVSYSDCKTINNPKTSNCSYVTSNMFCAGNPKNRTKSHGKGDSGGPMTYNKNGREYVVGVTSWNYYCNQTAPDGTITCENCTPLCAGYVSTYARVTAVLQWIKNEMKTNYDRC